MALKKREETPEVVTDEIIDDSEQIVSQTKMQKVVDYLSDYYNLAGRHFSLVGYADKGNKISATFENEDGKATFEVTSPDLVAMFTVED